MLKLENGIDLAKVRLYLRKAQAMMGQDAKYRSVQIYFDVDPFNPDQDIRPHIVLSVLCIPALCRLSVSCCHFSVRFS